ncbi:MAG: ACP S-malonyltransferase [Bacillota bacterium]|nr:ACP S-malonyltransferase [Bacillota bacterium]
MDKIAFLFPGQGSQYIGMGKFVYGEYPVARQTFEEANEALNFDLKGLCFEGDITELTKTENTQPAILTASVAAFRVYMQEIGILPEYMAGHSLGEISALCCAGAIEFKDAVKIVRQRGRFMQEAVPYGYGSMAAVSGIGKDVIEDECERSSKDGYMVCVSNYNSTEQIVISGHTKAVADAGEMLKVKGARVIPLKVSAPFHSPLMKVAADRFKEELMKYTLRDMKWPVISNVTSEPYPGNSKIAEYLSLQITSPVKWQSSIERLQRMGVNIAVEMGPQTVLKNLMKKNSSLINAYSFENGDDVEDLKMALSGKRENNAYSDNSGLKFLTKCIAISVCTKNRNWNNDEYQKGVVIPYKKLVGIKEELANKGSQPTKKHLKEAADYLKRILDTKLVPVDEQKNRFDQLFEETGIKNYFEDAKE